MTNEEFINLPASVQYYSIELANLDAEVEELTRFTPLNPRTLLNQTKRLEGLIKEKSKLVDYGASQDVADFFRDYKAAMLKRNQNS